MNSVLNLDYGADSTSKESCDICNAELKLQRIYFNGQKICPACYGQQIIKFQTNHPPKETKCPKCGHEL